jgi:hypothetical protein
MLFSRRACPPRRIADDGCNTRRASPPAKPVARAMTPNLEPLHAPREDRAVLVQPPVDRVNDLVAENLRIRDQLRYDLHGRSLADLSQLARTELLESARQWTAAYRNVPPVPHDPQGLIYLAGHQPQMFHPGVWLKDFALGELAKQHGAAAVNLIVDSDVLMDSSLRVPTGSVAEPQAVQIPFDRPDPKIPYEDRRIEDRELFASFDRRVIEQIAPLESDPLIARYWPMVRARAKETDNLGACLAQARHQLEESWGLETLEVPQSRVCAGQAFQWFTAHLLARLPEFRAIHNEALREYRRQYHVRSTAHPVPELAAEGDWLEAPLWVWTAADPRRRRLFVRSAGGEIVISDRGTWEVRLPLRADGDAGPTVERLLELQRGGVRIRSRALITTLWARLALGDLFIHGIGGAKYDRLTDRLMERFFGFRPPNFMVLSATLLLPIERERVSADCQRTIQRGLRDLIYHPERCLDGSNDTAAELIAAKRRWIETPQTAENARQSCQAIRAVNAALQPRLDDRRQQLLELQTRTMHGLRAESVLAWREYAFCLYPEATLRGFLSGLLHKT